MSENSEPTHVLTTDCILPEQGRCEAGTMFCESDVIPSTWSWLLQRGLIRSVEEIEAEADADDGDVNPNAAAQTSPRKRAAIPAALLHRLAANSLRRWTNHPQASLWRPARTSRRKRQQLRRLLRANPLR